MAAADARDRAWWETAVLYQIYPLTFADGDGNGVGDIPGIIERLDYLNNPEDDSACLGVDALWLSPVNKSPMKDNGYDVSDYCDVDPTFGTLDDFKALVQASHDRNIKVIMDLVINHTSSEHDWFLESSSSRKNPKSDWYIWRDPGYTGKEPNNWLSYFGGTAWTFCETRQQYYYHAFNKNQPDLNWRNPKVRKAIHDVVRFWLDIGVDGFRLDASSVYAKDKYCRDNPMKFGANHTNPYNNQHHLYDKDLPENHAIIRDIRKILDKYGDRLLIGETFIDSRLYDSASFYGIDNDELHLPFTFEFPFSPWYPGYLQREIQKKEILTPPGCWPAYFLDNHDIPRHLVRWNECSLCNDSQQIARAAATLLLTLRGTPVLYYGQELGMIDHDSIPPERLRDAVFEPTKDENDLETRDGVRTPMQWDSGLHAGFCHNPDAELWLPINPNYTEVNVASELADPKSVLSFYRSLLRIRKYQSKALRFGEWRTLIDYPYEHLAYVRQWEDETVLVMVNFANAEQSCHLDVNIDRQNWTVLLTNKNDLKSGEVIDVPASFKPFDILILQKFGHAM
ncbi:alpha-glucosidase [filamentous cyanobacterium LEGE 11480]|uniref:Alpha-glucosidase n=2 Tax=Romeriopsis TaxID=2992131 RepID=A0A928VN12_9CYAN|nr:alpha-glucosidase [Romeriopsis navalis LEGE 11480]